MGNWNISKNTFSSGYTARPSGGSGQGSEAGLWAVIIIGGIIILSFLGKTTFVVLGETPMVWGPFLVAYVVRFIYRHTR